MLPECADQNPFTSEDCGRALRELCQGAATQEDCEQHAFTLAGNSFFCHWARVVRFSDERTCAVASVEERCEAAINPGDVGCRDPCDEEVPPGLSSLEAIVSRSELVSMGCGARGGLASGPVGEWTALSNQRDPEREHFSHSCGADVPPPPALCGCYEVACARLRADPPSSR